LQAHQHRNHNMLHNLIDGKTKEELDQLGKQSNAIKTSGAHLVEILSVYNTTGDKNGNPWTSITVDMKTEIGETIQISEFYGNAKSASQEDIDKAERANVRLMSIMTRLAKSAGIPDLKAATAGHQVGSDAKQRETVTYPKFSKKKLYIVSTTEISADHKDPTKTYVKQIVDTNKFLDKDGKDAMGRDCIESFAAEAKTKIEIAYGHTANTSCLVALAKEQEKALGSAPAATAPLNGMPAVTQTTPAATANNTDI